MRSAGLMDRERERERDPGHARHRRPFLRDGKLGASHRAWFSACIGKPPVRGSPADTRTGDRESVKTLLGRRRPREKQARSFPPSGPDLQQDRGTQSEGLPRFRGLKLSRRRDAPKGDLARQRVGLWGFDSADPHAVPFLDRPDDSRGALAGVYGEHGPGDRPCHWWPATRLPRFAPHLATCRSGQRTTDTVRPSSFVLGRDPSFCLAVSHLSLTIKSQIKDRRTVDRPCG